MINRYGKIKRKQIGLITVLFVVCVGVSLFLVHGMLHSGEEKLKLSVNNDKNNVYLKSNGDIVTISESPNMKLIGEQPNLFVSDQLILYKNTSDTLYIVWFTSIPPPNTGKKMNDEIKYIHEEGYDSNLIGTYKLLGYKVFPSKAYL